MGATTPILLCIIAALILPENALSLPAFMLTMYVWGDRERIRRTIKCLTYGTRRDARTMWCAIMYVFFVFLLASLYLDVTIWVEDMAYIRTLCHRSRMIETPSTGSLMFFPQCFYSPEFENLRLEMEETIKKVIQLATSMNKLGLAESNTLNSLMKVRFNMYKSIIKKIDLPNQL